MPLLDQVPLPDPDGQPMLRADQASSTDPLFPVLSTGAATPAGPDSLVSVAQHTASLYLAYVLPGEPV